MADDEDNTQETPAEETPEHAVPTEDATEIAGSAEDAALEALQESKEHPQAESAESTAEQFEPVPGKMCIRDRENDGTFNLFGGLRTSMATCGHKDLAEFNRAEVVIAPALQTEGKEMCIRDRIFISARDGPNVCLGLVGLSHRRGV